MSSSPVPNNPKLYARVKAETKRKFKVYPSAYANGYLVKTYKKRGGTYRGKEPSTKKRSPRGEGGLSRWYEEKWVDIKTGKPCGRQKGEKRAYPACRPSKRVSDKTPKTVGEMTKAEKDRFKREKTSSKKISYQHKRSPTRKSPTKRSPRGSLTSPPDDFKTKKPLYKPYKSTRSGKKGMVYVMKGDSKRLIHFGDATMSDYTKHHDKDRRKRYLTRSAGITDDQGHLTKNDKNSANYWSRKINW